MAIKRLTPTVKKLGYLRLWRDDLVEIVTLTRNLENTDVALEADDCELDDLEADLPRLGPRVRNLTIRVARKLTGGSEPSYVMTMYFSNDGSKLEATNPNLQTRAVMASIEDYTAERRRIPEWFPRLNGKSRSVNAWRILISAAALWCVIMAFASYNTVAGKTIEGTKPNAFTISLPTAIIVTLIALSVIIASLIGTALSRNLLFTGTQSQAPTFWQRNQAGIIINVLVAAIFYLLGAVTPHF